jgi:hypothetical protein
MKMKKNRKLRSLKDVEMERLRMEYEVLMAEHRLNISWLSIRNEISPENIARSLMAKALLPIITGVRQWLLNRSK